MAFYSYNPEGQEKYNQQFESFLNVPRNRQFSLPTKVDSDNLVRYMPPWSKEGAFIKPALIHFNVGIEGKHLMCPNVLGGFICPFCKVKRDLKGEYERWKVDLDIIKAVQRYYSNVITEVQNANAVVKVYTYGWHIYSFVDQFRTSGTYGDITDPKTGRDLIITRRVRGKQTTDMVMAASASTPLLNPVKWAEEMFDLNKILPAVDPDRVNAAFKSHPWKLYNPNPTMVQVPDNIGNKKDVETPQEIDKSSAQEVTKPPVQDNPASEANRMKTLDALEARLRAKSSGTQV